MSYDCHVVLDSLSAAGKRLTTICATYPRFVHAEVLTHRDRARNSASSRAIPFPVMLERVSTDPVIPLAWGAEQAGMQTGAEIPEPLRPLARAIWMRALKDSSGHAQSLHYIQETAELLDDSRLHASYATLMSAEERLAIREYVSATTDENVRVHKSIPNRIVEPWMWITVVMTATEWNNFFRLRCHEHAEVHFQKIAFMIRDVLEQSQPVTRTHGQHLPYVTGYDEDLLRKNFNTDALMRISTARCARVSYTTHGGDTDPVKDLGLFDKLVQGSGFGHWSPMEHPACALKDPTAHSGPFVGWQQYRKTFANENAPG